MKIIVKFLALVLPFALPATASLTINTEAVKNSIVFIYAAQVDGTVDRAKPLGTGFFVFVPYAKDPGGFLLLLTARHMLDPVWAKCGVPNPSKIYLRLNLKGFDANSGVSGVDFIPVDLSGNDKQTHLFQSDDAQIDGEVVLLHAPTFTNGKYDFGAVPISAFATDSEASMLDTGDAIVSAGLLPGTQGEIRNYPVFKFGAISVKMGEPIATKCAEHLPDFVEKVWLLSVNLFPGASAVTA